MTDQDLLTNIQYALVEPPLGGQSFPSGFWTRDEVLASLNARQQQFLRETHLLVSSTDLAVLANATSVTLPADWLATVGCVWRATGNARSPLSPGESFHADLGLSTWESTAGTPLLYLDEDAGTLTLRLAPIPDANGTLELLYVARPTVANGAGVTLSVAEEFLAGIQYAVLGDLLGKIGRAHDPDRAVYCVERYELTKTLSQLLLQGLA